VERPYDGRDVTGFGGFDNSTCKRVLDLLELGDLRLGQVVIKRVAVVKLGVNTEVAMVESVLESSESDEYGSSRILRQSLLCQQSVEC